MANFWENLTTPIKKAAQGVSDWWKKSQDEAEKKRKEQERQAEENRKKLATAAQSVGNFLKGTAGKISELPKEVSKDISDYFEPVPDKVRVRDFVRELPGSTEKVGKGIIKFGKDILRSVPRAAAQFTLTAEGQKEFVPGTGVAPKFEKFLFGEEPIHDIKTTGEETVKAFGGSQNTAARFGLPVGLVLGTLDLIPVMPGKAKIAKELGEELVVKYGDDIARMIIKKGGKDLVEKALTEGGEKAVQKSGIAVKTIRELLYDLPANLMPAKGKATWTHGKLLWNTMRNQFGEANTLGKDITKNKGAVSWIIDTLEGGKKALAPLMEKYADQSMTTKQYKKLYAMFKSRDYGIEGYKKVMATLKGIEPAVIEKTIEPIKTAAKEVAEKIAPKVAEGIKVIRYGTPETAVTDSLRGGTWFMTPESKTYDFSKIAGVGGDLKMESKIAFKKPLVIKDAIMEDGSFAVINSGYEKYLPEKIAKTAEEMYTAVRDAEGTSNADLAIMNGLHDAGISEDAARKVIGTSNKFDAAMDLIISKGLKEKGYDALILENVSKGKVIDQHIFKLAEQTAEQAKAVPQELEVLAKEAGKYKNADEFVTAIWNKLNKEKTNVPGFPDGGIRDASSAVAKYLGQLDKGGYPTKGWFDSFKDFYIQTAGKAEQAIKTAGGTAEDILKRRDALEKLRYANPGDEKIANAIKKLDTQISEIAKGEKATPKLPKTKTAETELEAINAKGQPVEKAGKKKALANPRADQLKTPPPTPPRIPEEIPLADAPKPPEGSALSAIDKMLGETSKPKKVIDWLKQLPKKFTEAFSDRFAPMKRFEDELAKMAGQPIDINSSPYVAARMYAGRMGTVEAELNDLQKILNPLRKERADFTRYVLAKRATERASRGFANPAGVTEQQALQAINELKTKLGDAVFRQFESAEQAIQTWAEQAILQPAVKSGIISKESYEAIAKNNKHWIPFQVLDYLPDSAQADAIKTGGEIFSVSKQGIVKGLQGTEKAIRDPFEAIIDRLSQSVNLVKRNEVAKKMIDLRDQFGMAKELIVPIAKDAAAPKGWGSLSVFVDGKVTKWAVPEELSWAMHQMNEAEAGLIGKFMRFTSGAFRKGATTLYIPFSLSNAFRDAQMAIMTSKYGFNATDWLRGFGNGLKASFGWESKLYDDFMKNAGGFGGYIQNARSVSGAKKALFEPIWWKRAKAVINPFNLVSNFAEASELAPRLGVYSKAIKKGANTLEAAFEARNATVDFARSGQEMRIINMWIPFVNARWQALLNTARIFKERPIRSAAKASALIIAPGVTTYLWNTMNYPDLYDDIPQWAKDTYFTIIVGEDVDKDGNRVPKIIQIPKGDVGQVFYNPIEYALEFVRRGEPQNFAKLGLEWMSQISPIPFTRDGELSTSQVLSGGLPPIIRTPIELATNQSFFSGYPIVPRNLEKVAPTEQYDERTPQLAVLIGRAMGVSPMKLAYGVGGLLGGFGREAIDPAKILEMTTQRFYRTSGGAKINEAWNLKYDIEVGYNTARQQATRAFEAGDSQGAFEIMDNWNAEAEKLIPQITPYLAKDDPLEAESLRKSTTFQPADMARLQKSATKEALSEKHIQPIQPNVLQQSDLKGMRQNFKK